MKYVPWKLRGSSDGEDMKRKEKIIEKKFLGNLLNIIDPGFQQF